MADDVEIRCRRCRQTLTHVCNRALPRAVKQLREIQVDCRPVVKGGAEANAAPFFSEAYLYPLLGKEAARTVLAVVNNLIRAAGIEPDEMLRWESDRQARRRKDAQAVARRSHYLRQALTGKGGYDRIVAEKDEKRLDHLLRQHMKPFLYEDE